MRMFRALAKALLLIIVLLLLAAYFAGHVRDAGGMVERAQAAGTSSED